MGVVLSGLMVAAVHAGPNDGSGTAQNGRHSEEHAVRNKRSNRAPPGFIQAQ